MYIHVHSQAAFTSLADSDPGHREARAGRVRQHDKLLRYMSESATVTYFLFTYMYHDVKVCSGDVLCTDDYIHFMKCTVTDIVEWQCMDTDVSFEVQLWICPAGWPVGRVWLLPGVTPIQVQAH